MTSHRSGFDTQLPASKKLLFVPRRILEGAVLAGGYAILSVAVLSPLLLKRGYPFALDMSFGPQMKIPPEAFGLGVEFGRRLPDFIWISLLSEFIPPEIVVRLLLLAIPFTAGLTAHLTSRAILRDAGMTSSGALYAGLFYALNPFVYQRFAAGHWHILLGYAFLPLAIYASFQLMDGKFSRAARFASNPSGDLWMVAFVSAILGLTSFAISVMALMAFLLALLLENYRSEEDSLPRRLGRKAARTSLIVGAWLAGNATWIVPAVLKSAKAAEYTDLDWRAFLVRGRDQWEAFMNVLRLSGFYREDLAPPILARPSGWLASFAAAGLSIAGLAVLYRRHPRLFAFSLLAVSGFLFLALGERAPILGPILGWAYPRIPGWQIYRETQKLLAPVCFFYAALGGLAVSGLSFGGVGQSTSKGASASMGDPDGGSYRRDLSLERLLALIAALMVPFALSPDLFFGLRGRITVERYPDEWVEAQAALPAGDGKLLVFPWHQHIPLAFAGGRTNVNPAADFFTKEVVQSARAEFPGFALGVSDPIDDYVRNYIALGPSLTDAATPLAPLGVDSILVLKVADWQAYEFLDRGPGLRKVVDNKELRLYLVDAANQSLSGFVPTEEAPRVQMGTLAASDDSELLGSSCSGSGGRPIRDLPFAYTVTEGGCWLVPEAYDRRWRGPGSAGSVWSGAAIGVATDTPGRVIFLPAYVAIAAHCLSFAVLFVSAAVLCKKRFRQAQRPS